MRPGLIVGVLCVLLCGIAHAAQDSVHGDEYALVTYDTGTIIYNVTDPLNPAFVSFLPGLVGSGWHDVKTLGQYAYVVSEGTGHGMQIIVLTPVRRSTRFGTGMS